MLTATVAETASRLSSSSCKTAPSSKQKQKPDVPALSSISHELDASATIRSRPEHLSIRWSRLHRISETKAQTARRVGGWPQSWRFSLFTATYRIKPGQTYHITSGRCPALREACLPCRMPILTASVCLKRRSSAQVSSAKFRVVKLVVPPGCLRSVNRGRKGAELYKRTLCTTLQVMRSAAEMEGSWGLSAPAGQVRAQPSFCRGPVQIQS